LIADDIYVAFLSCCNDKKTIYCSEAAVIEERTPQSIRDFLPHKFRKANAFLRTSLRFIYRLPDMSPLFKIIFITRIFQQLFLPWLLILWVILAGSLVTLRPFPRYDVVIAGILWIFINFITCGMIYRFIKLPGIDRKTYGFFTMVAGLCLTMFILVATGISYPFHKPSAVYKRI
jgi:hypothetical protein